MPHFVISANRTADGGVVYLTADRHWVSDLASAAALASRADGEPGLAWARTREAVVCDAHLIKVRQTERGPAPLDTKQMIRAAGPEATLKALGFLLADGRAPHIHRSEQPEAPRPAPRTGPAEARL